MKVNIFTGYCPKEMYGLSRYDLNLAKNLHANTEIVCMKNKINLSLDMIRYGFSKPAFADISHVTNETFAYVLSNISGKKVITVHDLAVLILKNEYSLPQRKFYEFITGKIRSANHVIATSNFTKGQIKSILGIDESKITVIYHGIEKDFLFKPKKLEKKVEYQIIYVGNEKTHKNFMMVLQALNILRKNGRFRLVKIGRPQSDNRKMHVDYTKKHSLDVQFIDYIDDFALKKYYRESDVFITMSDYEGFCFPPLEAAASGIPIVLKNSPTLNEIYGKIGHMVSNPEEAANKIIELISSKSKYNQSAAKANEYAKTFTWEKCARKVEKVYNKVLMERQP